MNSEIREALALANASGYYFLQNEELTRPASPAGPLARNAAGEYDNTIAPRHAWASQKFATHARKLLRGAFAVVVFPLSDDNTDRRLWPFATSTFIALNVLVYVLFQQMGANDRFTYAFATVPQEIVSGRDLVTEGELLRDASGRAIIDPSTGKPVMRPGLEKMPLPLTVYFTLLSSMFMHGSLMHILGNLWFLWIFGDNVEDDFGHGRYVVFYLLCGFLASAAHVAMNWHSDIPSLGASGAISGVMGAYMVLHPKRRVNVLILRQYAVLPGIAAVGIWIAMQLFMGFASFSGQGDGVAYAAHIGGFAAGAILAPLFKFGRPPPQALPDETQGGYGTGSYEANDWSSRRRRPRMDDLFDQ